MTCGLRIGHNSQEHHWEEVDEDDDTLLSATWIATGPVTFIGKSRV